MSKIADVMIGIQEAYEYVKHECMFWTGQMDEYGYRPNDAVAAAQYYGQMCAFARIQMDLLGNDELLKDMEGFMPKLYKSDYESSQ